MRTKILGRTGLEVSIVGLGSMYSGKPANSGISTPDMDFELGVQTILAAIEGGCTLIDTAYVYSRGGSEKIVGEALKRRPDLAAKCTVVTKVGYLGEGRDHSYDGILQAFEGSQERLGIEKFEVVYIHDAGGYPVEEVMRDDGALGALRKLQNEGLVRWIGIACNDPEINTPFIVTGEFDAAVVPDAWSLLNQTAAGSSCLRLKSTTSEFPAPRRWRSDFSPPGRHRHLRRAGEISVPNVLPRSARSKTSATSMKSPSWRLHCSGARAIRRSRALFPAVERPRKPRRTRKRDRWISPKHSGTTWHRWSDTGRRA